MTRTARPSNEDGFSTVGDREYPPSRSPPVAAEARVISPLSPCGRGVGGEGSPCAAFQTDSAMASHSSQISSFQYRRIRSPAIATIDVARGPDGESATGPPSPLAPLPRGALHVLVLIRGFDDAMPDDNHRLVCPGVSIQQKGRYLVERVAIESVDVGHRLALVFELLVLTSKRKDFHFARLFELEFRHEAPVGCKFAA